MKTTYLPPLVPALSFITRTTHEMSMSDVSMRRDPRIRRAIAIASRIRSRFPYKDYGRAYMKRGSALSLEQFGPTYKEANPQQRANRKMYGWSGRGLYMGKGRYRGKGIYRGQGGFFGDLWEGVKSIAKPVLGTVAPMAGQMLTSGLTKLTGQGEYVNTNDLVRDGQTSFEPPMFTEKPDGASVTISYKEYVGQVYGPPSVSTFQNTTYSINPGLERTFPWLSQIAANYDEYTIHQLIFTYRSTVADFASASGQVGTIVMATQYNANSDPFNDKVQMMQYDAAMSGKSSHNHVHGVECDPSKLSGSKGKYVRVNPLLNGKDANTFDHGVFNIAVTDIPATYANQALGELWVSYTIELRKPKFFTGRGLAITTDAFARRQSTDLRLPFGTEGDIEILYGQQNSMGCKFLGGDLTTPIPVGLPSLMGGGTSSVGWYRSWSITLPSDYAGIIKLTYTRVGGSDIPSFWIGAEGNIVNWKQGLNAAGQDNVVGYSEVIIASGHVAETYLRVNAATNGVDNTIYCHQGGSAATSAFSSVIMLTEINSGLSFKQDGTNDAIVYVNKQGTIA